MPGLDQSWDLRESVEKFFTRGSGVIVNEIDKLTIVV